MKKDEKEKSAFSSSSFDSSFEKKGGGGSDYWKGVETFWNSPLLCKLRTRRKTCSLTEVGGGVRWIKLSRLALEAPRPGGQETMAQVSAPRRSRSPRNNTRINPWGAALYQQSTCPVWRLGKDEEEKDDVILLLLILRCFNPHNSNGLCRGAGERRFGGGGGGRDSGGRRTLWRPRYAGRGGGSSSSSSSSIFINVTQQTIIATDK